MIVLFDLDGVIMDTESQYSIFWNRAGKELLGLDDFGTIIKGQTLTHILKHFEGASKSKDEIIAELYEYERNMSYDYIPGADEFMKSLKGKGIPMAIVTSSNDAKMENVRRVRPELWELAEAVLTSEHFSKSKPDPECFIKGMEVLGGRPEDTYVFEDSIHGINAGRSAGAKVIGLATTNPREAIVDLCDKVIDDFKGFELA
ncbi:MAG: HAD family phosphatase [Bacteroidales bacterium]|nr:HAD family phosphatase [Bacteroidales bacterium]